MIDLLNDGTMERDEESREVDTGGPLIAKSSRRTDPTEMKFPRQPSEATTTLPIDKVTSGSHKFICRLNRKVKSKWEASCSIETLKGRVPIVSWLPSYTLSSFLFDLIAGITVGLTTIPQAIAYAAVAGLPLQYGLYSAFMGPFVYVILGTVKEASIGPTAVMSLMTVNYASEGGPAYAALLAFLAGWVELIAGLLNLGFLVEFISAPVISGFCSAAAILVASTQVKGLFGLKYNASSFIEIWREFFTHLSSINPQDAALGCSVTVLLLLIRKMTSLKNCGPLKRVDCLRNRFVDGFVWFFATSRNAVAVIGGCVAAYVLEQHGLKPFTLTGDIKAGLPPFTPPPFSLNRTVHNETVYLNFGDICSELGAAIGLVPLIAILEQVAIARAFASGKRLDATQEMIALGVGNILGSFFGSMPITASFGRSSVQSASGVKSPMANVYSGILVVLSLYFLMPSLAYIPKAILASVIITSVIFMVELDEVKHLWNSRRIELIPFTVTFLCCLFVNVEYGILVGAGVHLLLFTYTSNRARSQIITLPGDGETAEGKIIIRANNSLYFPGVETFRQALNEAQVSITSNDAGRHYCLIIDLSSVREIDYTALKMLKSIAAECRRRHLLVIHFANASPKVAQTLSAALPMKDIAFLGKMNESLNLTDEV